MVIDDIDETPGALSFPTSGERSRSTMVGLEILVRNTVTYSFVRAGRRGGNVLPPGARPVPTHVPREQNASLQALQGPSRGREVSGGSCGRVA